LKDESLDASVCQNRFGRGYQPVVRQATELMKEGGREIGSLFKILVFPIQNQSTKVP
jgi:hypothetical protein